MLGVRKVFGCQIDAHQGDAARFACDRLVGVYELSASLASASADGVSHLVLDAASPPGGDAAALESLRAFLAAGRRGSLRRITFLVPTAERYRQVQDALAKAFPEEG